MALDRSCAHCDFFFLWQWFFVLFVHYFLSRKWTNFVLHFFFFVNYFSLRKWTKVVLHFVFFLHFYVSSTFYLFIPPNESESTFILWFSRHLFMHIFFIFIPPLKSGSTFFFFDFLHHFVSMIFFSPSKKWIKLFASMLFSFIFCLYSLSPLKQDYRKHKKKAV